MRRLLLLATAAIALPIVAHAAPIVGELQLTGPVSFTPAGSNAGNSTGLHFAGPLSITSTTGDFTSLGTFNPATGNVCATCGTGFDFGFAPFSGPQTIYSVLSFGVHSAFDLLTETFSQSLAPLPTLAIHGTGTVTLDNFDPTPGDFTLTTQGGKLIAAFSAATTATPTPEPATLALLGAGIIGLGLIRRRTPSI